MSIKKNMMALVSVFIFGLAYASPPMNLSLLKQDIIHYHASGHYDRDVAARIAQAKEYLVKRIAENKKSAHPKKLAIVLDIDETVLSNYSNLKALNFGGTEKQMGAAFIIGNDPAIKPALDFYNFAKRAGINIFFITGKYKGYRSETIANLKKAGFGGWSELILNPNVYDGQSAVHFKLHARKKTASRGYDIVLNVGDQLSDLRGGYADRTFKLPNFFYYIS